MDFNELAESFKKRDLVLEERAIKRCVDFHAFRTLPEDRGKAMRDLWHTYWCEVDDLEAQDNKYLFDLLGGALAKKMLEYVEQEVDAEIEARIKEDEAWFSR